MGKDCRSLKHQHFDAVRSCQVEMLCLMQGDGRAVPFPRPLPRLAQNDPNLIQWHVCHSNLSQLVGSPQGKGMAGLRHKSRHKISVQPFRGHPITLSRAPLVFPRAQRLAEAQDLTSPAAGFYISGLCRGSINVSPSFVCDT